VAHLPEGADNSPDICLFEVAIVSLLKQPVFAIKLTSLSPIARAKAAAFTVLTNIDKAPQSLGDPRVIDSVVKSTAVRNLMLIRFSILENMTEDVVDVSSL
jgi:hypothetical protein